MKILRIALAVLSFSGGAFSSDLNLKVISGGSSAVLVAPGGTVPYEVIGELSDGVNEGLAMFSFDLAFSGGPLAPASAPTSGPLLQFASPLGLNNPAGFGGTVAGGVLRQVGGAQNTINNVFAPFPSGTVTTGVGAQGFPVSLVSGALTAPTAPGVYTLSLSGVFANAIRLGETGFPFWAVEAAPAGTITNLTIQVESLSGDVTTLSLSSPGTLTMSLNAGVANAGRVYLVLGSITGTFPGVEMSPGVVLPLNIDVYTFYTVQFANGWVLKNTFALLDGQGKATAMFRLPPGADPDLAGTTIHHAFVLFSPFDFTSNPVPLTLIP